MITLTVPAELRRIPRWKRKQFFEAFFEASSNAIKELACDRLGGTPGMVGVLHTNSRKLDFHPHIHYIVPAIVLNRGENTVKKITKKFFLQQQVLANLFRGKLLSKLTELKISFPKHLYGICWQADCDLKGNGAGALEYLSRYLIKGVVSQESLSYTKDGKVRLSYIESKTNIRKNIKLTEIQFLNKLVQHVLPKGFRRVREYGFLAPAAKKMLTKVQLIFNAKPPIELKPEAPKVICKCCKKPMKMLIHKIHFQWYEERQKGRSPPEKTS
ncbi:MAG: transposase [Lentisphaeraceae bacterium]|nr:transposase [Lentisphaeraceae bacterium]